MEIDRLASLCVGDVMSKHLVQVSLDRNMTEVALILIEKEISGVVVVDAEGRCVGLVSGRSFVVRAAAPVEDAARDTAERFMVHNPVTIGAEASLVDAAREMSIRHTHRLPVLDAERRPIGILTSADIAAALVAAVDEQES